MFGNTAGYLIIVLIGGALVACALILLRDNIRELFARYPARAALMDRVLRLPLGNMLAKRNISPRWYFLNQSAASISGQIRSCEHCDSIQACAAFLSEEGQPAGNHAAFCPNDDTIARLERAQQDAALKHGQAGQVRSAQNMESIP